MRTLKRSHNETFKKHAKLEAEHAKLKITLKDATEMHETAREAMAKKHADAINQMQSQFENEKTRLNEQMQMDAATHRSRQLDEINNLKQHHNATMQRLLQEKKDEYDQNIRMALESERIKMKCKLEHDWHLERKKLKCQLEDTWQHEKNAQLKKFKEDQAALKNELLDECKKKEEERTAKFNHELNRLKQKEEEQNARFADEAKTIENERNKIKQQFDDEREQIRRDEQNQQVHLVTQMKMEREKMNADLEIERQQMHAGLEMERQRMHAQLEIEQQRILANASREMELKYNERVAENAAAHGAAMQKLNKEREKIVQMKELLMTKKKQWDLEYNKLEKIQMEVILEKERVMENARTEAEALLKSNEEVLAQHKQQSDATLNATLNQHRAEFEEAMKKLNKQRDDIKLHESMREKEYAEKVKKNNEKLDQATRAMELKLQHTMDKLNEERQEIKWRLEEEQDRRKLIHSEQEKLRVMQTQVEQTRLVMFEQHKKDAALQRKASTDELNKDREQLKHEFEESRQRMMEQFAKENEAAQMANVQTLAEQTKELDTRFNVAMNEINERRTAFDAEMKKTREENRVSMERLRKENEAQRKMDDDAVNARKKELDAQFDAAINQRRIAFEEAVKNANMDKEKFKNKIEAECEQLLQQHKAEIDAKFNSIMNERNTSFAQAMQNVNDERVQMKAKIEAENNAKIKSMNQERDKTNKQIDEQWAKLNEFKKENENAIEKVRNELSVEKMSNEKMLETALITMKALNEKSDRVDFEMEKLRTFQEELAKKRDKQFEEKTQLEELRNRLEEERNSLNQEKKILEEQRISFTSENNPNKYKSGLIKSLMDEMEQLTNSHAAEREKLIEINDSLRQRLEDKPMTENLQETVVANLAHFKLIHNLDFNNKRVVIYSHYSQSNHVESYNWLTIEYIQHYFDYVIILTNCPNKWNMGSINHNKIHLLSYNMKSDFRNYGVFIMQANDKLVHASCMCLVNDSFVVVDVNAFGCCMKRAFEIESLRHDFIGLTSSYENSFHMQSYFLCLNASTMQSVLGYFKKIGLPDNHDAAISKYELGLSTHLVNEGFSHFSFVSNNDMKYPLNTTCCKWSEVLNETGIVKRQHFFKKYAYKSMTDDDISDVAEKYAYNKHFMNFLKYHQIKVIPPSKSISV